MLGAVSSTRARGEKGSGEHIPPDPTQREGRSNASRGEHEFMATHASRKLLALDIQRTRVPSTRFARPGKA